MLSLDDRVRRSGLARLLPMCVRLVEEIGDEGFANPFEEEARLVAAAAPSRRNEFLSARACAHRALRALGAPHVPILRDDRRPVWPQGYVGSITHCVGYRAAAVARVEDVVTLGIDAEPDEPLPVDVLSLIASGAEREALAGLSCGHGAPHWDRLLFSAKESVFKAWSPVMRTWLGFEDVHLEIDPSGGFHARLLTAPLVIQGDSISVLHGRWAQVDGLLLTGMTILATSGDGDGPSPLRP